MGATEHFFVTRGKTSAAWRVTVSARYVHASEDAMLDAISRPSGRKGGHTQNQAAQLQVAKEVTSAVQ